jgi:uncharacterized membrane protein YdjX (TVP38/TMEM64 family)
MRTVKNNSSLVIFWIIVLLLILVPFAIAGQRIDTWVASLIASAHHAPLTTGVILSCLLAADILIPTPSSIVSTACGQLLGILGGTLASTAGMTISCVAGYWLGRTAGKAAAVKMATPEDLQRMRRLAGRYGDWMLIIARPVPVLAETSVFYAGISMIPFGRFLFLTTIANISVSIVYASIGAASLSVNSFLSAFAASIILPGIAMLTARRFLIKRSA